jgi:Major tropism determinant N-terminal domain
MGQRLKFRRDSFANWAASVVAPVDGEPIWCASTRQFKIGNGVGAWAALPTIGSAYLSAGSMTPNAGAVLPSTAIPTITNATLCEFIYLLRCGTPQGGYAAGDRVMNTVNTNVACWFSGGFVGASIGNAVPQIIPKTGGAPINITPANWALEVYYRILA